MDLAEELQARGFAEQSSADLGTILAKKRKVYLGIDPTADSAHVGHLVPFLLMKRLADAGHKIIFLVGGGTGMIGDPRDTGERVLLDMRTIEKNKKAFRNQLQKILGKKIEMVDNADWLLKLPLIEFLRDIGKHFTVNELIKRDLIKRRLETPDESISYTEFSYSLLQGYDFLHLFQKKGVDLQVGGSDQWTNILSGVELIRRKAGGEAFGFTWPLITDANGKKFGKSEGNAVWLDPLKTTPFQFYQFWMNLPDERLESYFKVYTFLSLGEIEALIHKHQADPSAREAQETLARLMTEIVHGPANAVQASEASAVLFSSRTLGELSREARALVLREAPSLLIPSKELTSGYGVVDGLVNSNLASSKSDARRLIEGRGVSLNGGVVASVDQQLTLADFSNGLALLKKGKHDLRVLVLH